MAEPCPYALFIEGDWSADISKTVKNKLQIYFQSKKKSNGGDCRVEYEDTSRKHAVVWFKNEETRKRVLEKQNHKLNVGKENVRLTVRLQEEPEENPTPEPEKETPCKPEEVEDAVEILSRASHTASHCNTTFEEVVCEEIPEFTAVLLENVSEKITQEILAMMVENISNLSEENGDFSLEIIHHINKAVVSFKTSSDAPQFLTYCVENKRFKQNKIVAKPLEVTRSVKVENLSPNTSEELLWLYFEQSGAVDNITMMPEDMSAVISFKDHKVLETIRGKTQTISKAAVKAYPYYESLGTALYGKERPQWKLPDPFTENIDLCIWKFLITKKKHVTDINETMAEHFCELNWQQSGKPLVNISPSPAILKQKSLTAKHISAWKGDALSVFLNAMSKYKSFECHVNSSVWKISEMEIRSAVTDAVILVPDMVLGKVMIAGMAEDVDQLQRVLTEIVDKATKRIEREQNSVTEKVPVVPAMYNILKHNGLVENIMKDHPELKLVYKPDVKSLILSGLAVEVFSIKSKVLEAVMQMKRKQVELNPHIVSFLSEVDNEELSYCIFTANGINAMCETQESVVFIIGNTDRALNEAEKQIKNFLDFQCIDVEDSKVIKKQEWVHLNIHLDKEYNSPKKRVVIKILKEQVVIAGYCDSVMQVCQHLSDFVDKNTHMKESVSVKSKAVIKLIQDKKTDLWWEVVNAKDVKIDFAVQTNQPKINLEGPRSSVLEVKRVFETIVRSLHSDVLQIKKPGAKKFFKDKEEMYVNAAMHQSKCVVILDDGDFMKTAEEIDSSHFVVQLSDGLVVSVYQGDICRCNVDAVVNATNEDLQHIGGLAGALLKAAGPELQTECNRYISKKGKLKPGQAVLTEAGNLPCKYVIHTLGPRWNAAEAKKAVYHLEKAVRESLNMAETYNCTSIAIPAISSGIFGFPLELCAETIVKCVHEHCEDIYRDSTLKKIHLVDNDDKTVQAMTAAAQKIFADYVPQVRAKTVKPAPQERRPLKKVESRDGLQEIQTKEGLTIILREGNIQDASTDVIVNTIAADLSLNSGAVSKAIFHAAGPKLQTLLDKAAQKSTPAKGKVLKTEGCKLKSDFVFHVIGPRWDSGTGDAEKILKGIIKECLQEAEKLQQTSITFPAIGTGNLGFPKPLVASVMMEQVLKFSSKQNPKHLQEVVFLVHSSDTQAAFRDEFKNKFQGQTEKVKQSGRSSAQHGADFVNQVSNPSLGVHEMLMGTLQLQVVTGDITKETTDVIVNSSNNNFTLKTGVSKAILEAAGQEVEMECTQLGAQPNNEIIITKNGNLQCKKIIHIPGQTNPIKIKDSVGKVLQLCEQNKFTSVAFPALGTGQGGVNPSTVADAMLDSVVDFTSQKMAQSLKKVRIIVFQPQMLTEFFKSMQAREGTALVEQDTIWTKVKSFGKKMFFGNSDVEEKGAEQFVFVEENIDPTVFQICGETEEDVKKARSWVTDLIVKEQDERTIRNEWICYFSEEECEKIKRLQKKLQISVKVKCTKAEAFIQVAGLTRDVLTAVTEIQDMLKKIQDDENLKRETELASNLVEWQYEQGTKYEPFDIFTNLRLEQAVTSEETELTVKIQNKNFKVFLPEGPAVDDKDTHIKIKRVNKTEAQHLETIPSHWDDMKGSKGCFSVQLQPTTKEYQEVEALFKKTCGNHTIVMIQRIQNPFLWKNYQIKKQAFDDKNGKGNNEKQLFHGTACDTIKTINSNGFNRSFCGKNAVAYGNGTYFAVNASYSASGTYSVPDPQGQKYMYLTRVLTGVFTNGRPGMIVPPAKNAADPTDLYDSVTDNPANPTIFVVFNDVQAYPEYLLTFR
ncbi:protein mono-ADP-ribosyltransferase PARP14-like isoform X2 [Polyodon spathula]|uniref:protein mono-ADP-ribosyltransferase PARP14-like isoform X2 n=1 Tax=Polyodon spathula TaxID=7913 RepID=UPI001B7DF697|nr:protein mono-ADP-ribosyltransferase PARP14-like isoform X2 [Polyodon spathula]